LPFNYGSVNNFGVREASGELILMLNNDVEVIRPDWLDHMVGLAIKPGIGVVGAKLYFGDDTIQHAGVVVGMGEVAGHVNVHVPGNNLGYMGRLVCVQNFSAVTGACMMVRKEIYQSIGGLDEDFPLCYSDVDLCLRIMQAGYRNVWTPDAELYHHESKTRGLDDTPEKHARYRAEVARFKDKWAKFYAIGDPHYNRNFRLDTQHPLPRVT
jgi:GT2 family glycosyltransferase